MPRSPSPSSIDLRGASGIARTRFGRLPDGTDVDLFTLDAGGLTAKVATYGAVVQELWLGEEANVVLGYRSLPEYLENRGYMGAIVGRFANRIAGARFELDGVEHRLSANESPNCLHGGSAGFDKRVWRVVRTRASEGAASIALRLESADGEQGFPGALVVEVTYTVGPGMELRLDFRAKTSAPTVVNLASHMYWQLAGEGAGAIDDHVLTLGGSRYLPVAPGMFPTGEVAPVAGTPLDFTAPTAIGARVDEPFEQLVRAGGYDHHVVLDGDYPAARLVHPGSGRALEVETTEPGIQVYSGNHLAGAYRRRGGIALEPQHCPDSPNHPEFPSTVLRPGRVFASTTVYRLSRE